jgi:hypothetical protein
MSYQGVIAGGVAGFYAGNELHETQLRWFDDYLKGIDTGSWRKPP